MSLPLGVLGADVISLVALISLYGTIVHQLRATEVVMEHYMAMKK